jgi:hypothetical protein
MTGSPLTRTVSERSGQWTFFARFSMSLRLFPAVEVAHLDNRGRLISTLLTYCASTLLLTATAAAQTGAPADPVSGTWIGRLGPGTNPAHQVTLELQSSSGKISGTLTGLEQPGDVRSGSYDVSTGALRLELGITGQAGVRMTLEGTAIAGTAVGRATLSDGGGTGTFILTRSDGASTKIDTATATVPREQLRKAFEELSGNIATAAALVPPDKYGYKPVDSVRSFGEQIGHIVDGYHYYCGRAAGRSMEWSDATAKAPLDKATLASRLQDASAQCAAAFASGNVGPLIVNFGHANLHYGNLVTYLRMLDMVPPSSR